MRILITGGAGFVGSTLARKFREDADVSSVYVLDNLRRRGSEINLSTLKDLGIRFVHGDIRNPTDLAALDGEFDLMVEASAEPSVRAGQDGSPGYVVESNLVGTYNCLEFARLRVARLVFLSSSRVYSIAPLRAIALNEGQTRLVPEEMQTLAGVSTSGITESFPTHLPRSFYGATKLASEMLIQEYVASYGMQAVINRCGVIAGAGQFGKVDQGVFTLWVAYHFFKKPLVYTGFGGQGMQVRDLLHPDDLFQLIKMQLAKFGLCNGEYFNVGGGVSGSVSLREFTELCRSHTGNKVAVASQPETNPADIPWYVSDSSKLEQLIGWRPMKRPDDILQDIVRWVGQHEKLLRPILLAS